MRNGRSHEENQWEQDEKEHDKKEKGKMKIKTVRYGRVVSMGAGTYETERLEMEAELDPKETPTKALQALKAEVNKQLGVDDDLSDAEVAEMKRKIARAERRSR